MVPPEPDRSLFGTRGCAILEEMSQTFTDVGSAIHRVSLRDGLIRAMALTRGANRYLDEQAPWKSVDTDPAAAAATMHVMIQVLNGLKVLFAPYIPASSQKLHQLLGCAGDVSACRWEAASIPSGRVLPPPTPLFKKIDSPTPTNALP
jgi:methionyl-tRNA synthetase